MIPDKFPEGNKYLLLRKSTEDPISWSLLTSAFQLMPISLFIYSFLTSLFFAHLRACEFVVLWNAVFPGSLHSPFLPQPLTPTLPNPHLLLILVICLNVNTPERMSLLSWGSNRAMGSHNWDPELCLSKMHLKRNLLSPRKIASAELSWRKKGTVPSVVNNTDKDNHCCVGWYVVPIKPLSSTPKLCLHKNTSE